MAGKQEPSESMTVEIELENGEVVMCEVITILTVAGKDYIALLPKGQENKEEQDVWFYGYSENPDDPNEEPELIYIESDDEYGSCIKISTTNTTDISNYRLYTDIF